MLVDSLFGNLGPYLVTETPQSHQHCTVCPTMPHSVGHYHLGNIFVSCPTSVLQIFARHGFYYIVVLWGGGMLLMVMYWEKQLRNLYVEEENSTNSTRLPTKKKLPDMIEARASTCDTVHFMKENVLTFQIYVWCSGVKIGT